MRNIVVFWKYTCVPWFPVLVWLEYEALSLSNGQSGMKKRGFVAPSVFEQWNAFKLCRPPGRRGLDRNAVMKGVAEDIILASGHLVP
jgi:hypothetical protein